MRLEGLLEDERKFRQAAGLFLAVGLGCRLVLSARYFGFLSGDDVEILETGLRWALQLPYEPWEIRNTLLPALLVAPMGWLGGCLGIDSPMLLVWLSTLPFAVLSTANIALVHRLVLVLGGDRLAAMFASLLLGTHWLAIGFGGTVYPRTPATTCILLAAVLLASPSGRPSSRVAAGGLAALAFSFRYSEAIFLLPLMGLAMGDGDLRRRLRGALLAGTGFAAATLLFVGLADLVEWGAPFASLRAFAQYTLVEGKASARVANQPGHWYLWHALRWIPPAAVAGLWFARRVRVPAVLVAFVVVPLVALSAIHHKELRYLQGVLPFACAIGAFWLAGMWRGGRRRLVVGLLVVTVGWSGIHLRFLGKKSMAAVEAAHYLANTGDRHRRLALQQPWAFGDRLFLPAAVGVRELSMELTGAAIRREVAGVDTVGLYSEAITAEISDALQDAGLCLEKQFAWGRSRRVSIYSTCPQAD